MLISLLVGAALAVPAPLLGPDGPTWVGPLPPVSVDGAASPRGSVVTVDPVTGALWVEEDDAPGVRRVWDGRRWTVDGGGVDAAWPRRAGFTLELDPAGALTRSTSSSGLDRRYRYDASGRLTGIRWADGGRLDVRYDDAGRVVETRGPGVEVARLTWGKELRIDRTPGGPLRVRPLDAGVRGGRGVEVADGAGRIARTWYDTEAGRERVVAWEGPRGARTTIDRDGDRLTILAGGRSWILHTDADDRPTELTMPSGGTWSWTWSESGAAIGSRDPTGRVERWSRDASGRVIAIARGGREMRVVRDPAGRISAIVSANGASTQMTRDPAGRVVEIVDAAGNSVTVNRGSSGAIEGVVGRTDGQWSLTTDALGRVASIIDPTRHELEVKRDSAGRVTALASSHYGVTRLGRGADGGITRVESPDGRVTGVIRDAHGQVRALARPDGSRLSLERDAAGDLRWAAVGRAGVEVERGPLGLATRAGAVRWRRDANGWVSHVVAPGMDLALERDLAGRLWGARAGSWVVGVQHDAAGLPIAWRGSDGDLLVQRDANGEVVIELREQRELRVLRDPRGFVHRLTLGDRIWRITRDAGGRPLTLVGPQGLKAGIDWDSAGRPTLLRYPGGTLQRIRYERDVEHMEVDGPGGEPLLRRSMALGPDGWPRWSQEDEAERSAWRYDPAGQLVTIEQTPEQTWSWAPGLVEGPRGQVQVIDPKGNLTEARVNAELPAWGVADRLFSAFRDLDGTLTGVTGDLGLADVTHDPLGRLTEVVAAGQRWRLEWDPLGRLSALVDPTGAARAIRWSPDGAGGSRDLLLVGDDQPWLPGGPSAVAVLTPGGPDAIVHVGGDPRWVVDSAGQTLELRHTPMGLPDSGGARLAGAGGSLQVFAGGPLLVGDTALDPVGGQPTSGRTAWSWEASSPRGPVGRAHLDPDGWAPRGLWHDPARLLEAMGEIQPVVSTPWRQLPAADRAFPWLPATLEGPPPPLGPPRWSVPLEDESIVEDLILAMLPGAGPIDPTLLVRGALAREPDLDLSAALPPGTQIPGLEPWWGSDPDPGVGTRYLPVTGL